MSHNLFRWCKSIAFASASLWLIPTVALGSLPAGISEVGPVQPSSTGMGISFELFQSSYHYVYLPTAVIARKNVLVVFLGGSYTTPSEYTDISEQAALLGYGVLDLRYQNDDLVATACGTNATTSDNCYTQYRGDIIFGNGVAYGASVGPYTYTQDVVTQANSIVNRLVNLIDWLATNDTVGGSAYWSQFLIADGSSPYTTSHYGNVYPNWSKIVISGHSQGGGHAAFIASVLSVRRAVLLSAPDDNYNNGTSDVPASWITASSATALTSYWGLRNANEGSYGANEAANWSSLGGGGLGGSGSGGATATIGDGSETITPAGAQRLVTTVPDSSALTNHSSTAVNGTEPAGMDTAWDVLFTANGTD